MASGLPGGGDPVAGVGPLEIVGEEVVVARCNIGTATLVGTGALMGGVHPNEEVFITASLAAISARFCAMRSVLEG
jgi:carbonic anhydrase/acetyltransferase-like protein (isoleucine patch superfamily)